jgi:hypothetical protein
MMLMTSPQLQDDAENPRGHLAMGTAYQYAYFAKPMHLIRFISSRQNMPRTQTYFLPDFRLIFLRDPTDSTDFSLYTDSIA